MATVMWEVRAADGRLDDLVDWVRTRADASAQIYRSDVGEPRVVVIDPSGTAERVLGDPPPELVGRPPHAWQFEAVPRT